MSKINQLRNLTQPFFVERHHLLFRDLLLLQLAHDRQVTRVGQAALFGDLAIAGRGGPKPEGIPVF